MKEILLTSSVLIVALLVLRLLFRSSISRRVQYALWGLVLVRLLIPVSLPALDFSVLSVTEPVRVAVTHQLEDYSVYMDPVAQGEAPESIVLAPDVSTPPIVVADRTSDTVTEYDYKINGTAADAAIQSADGTHITWYAKALPLADILTVIWWGGMAVMACWLLVTNLRFQCKLLRSRIPYPVESCKYRTYLVESGLPSPCLFGLFRPAIYLTPAAVESPGVLRHVIAHETTHAKHLDPLWALLRSLCLVIYWFDPLVWAAAFVSKTDCELACDEGAMKQLGEGERLAYGHTLLALIPVRHGGTNPMLSATTMTSDKKHLKDRITRIAENRQTVAAALFLVVSAVIVVCAVTFTGGKPPVDQDEPVKPVDTETPVAALSGEELAWFNERFFNRTEESGINLRNQFLSSQYRKPEDIDLYELFYCGTGIEEQMSETEWKQVGAFDEEGQAICPTTKMSVSAMDEVLQRYLGLTLADMDRKGLEHFDYLEEYDAYYHTHGDTNYRSSVTISAGEREGNLTRLYYPDNFMGTGWMCVTLRDNGSGGYWFVSNLPCDKPAISTVFPEGDPWMTIPLGELDAREPLAVEVTLAFDDCAERGHGHRLDNDVSIRPYLSTDGNVYAAISYREVAGTGKMHEWQVGRFFQYPEGTDLERCTLDFFSDLFGYNGIVVSYNDWITGNAETGGEMGTIYDFYAFPDDKTPLLLARAMEGAQVSDLDGDGKNELLTGCQLFFERDGQIVEANIKDLLQQNWTDMAYWDFGLIDVNRRCLTVSGTLSMPEWGEESAQAWFLRQVYFDGENLLVYRDLPETEDHMAVGIPVNFPNEVYIAARERAMAAYIATKSGEEGTLADQNFDDWRLVDITPVENAYPYYPGVECEVYRFAYQFHSADPGNVWCAGGMYVQEDGWVGGFYTGENSPYLVFLVQEDGSRVPLENYIAGDYESDSHMFAAAVNTMLLNGDFITWDDISAEDLCVMLYADPTSFLRELSKENTAVRHTALYRIAYYYTEHKEAETEQSHLVYHALEELNMKSHLGKLTPGGKAAYEELLTLLAEPGAVPEQTTGPIAGTPLTMQQRGASMQDALDALERDSTEWISDGGFGVGDMRIVSKQRDGSHASFLVTKEGKVAQLPLPYADGSLRYAKAENKNLNYNDKIYTYEARVPYAVYSERGELLNEAGLYHYTVDLNTYHVVVTFTAYAPALPGSYANPLSAGILSRVEHGSLENALMAPAREDTGFVEEKRIEYGADSWGTSVQFISGYSGTKTMANTVWYLAYEDGMLTRLPWPADTVELSVKAPGVENYCMVYEAVTANGKTYAYFINPLYRTYSVKELKSTRTETALTPSPTPISAEAALEELQKHSAIVNRWDGPAFSLLEMAELGVPHSSRYLCLLADGVGVMQLPSMPRVGAFEDASPDQVEFSEDGAVLTYSCYFQQRDGTELGSPSENVYHEAGLYTYRVEIMNRRVIQTYEPRGT